MATRRSVLLSLAALPLAPACAVEPGDEPPPEDDPLSGDDDDSTPAPEPFEVVGDVDPGRFPSGIQVTDALPDAVLLALRTTEAEVVVRVGRLDDSSLVLDSAVLPVIDGIVGLEVTGLEPDTLYEIYAADPLGERRSELGTFRTALAPGTSRAMRVAVVSCMGRAGAPWPSMGHAAGLEPDVMLMLGDTVYADGSSTLDHYRGFWDEALETTGLQDISRATSLVATWDDHEVANNWSWAQHGSLVESAITAFRESFPQRPGPDPDRVYRSLSWGDAVELFVLDCRADRGAGLYLSVAQMDWLKAGLSTSNARFKLILNSVPIIDFGGWIGNISADDRWQGTPGQREELLAHIEDEGLTGVLFLSGDMHFGSVCRVSPQATVGAGLWEVMAGPAGSNINPMAWVAPADNPQYDLVIKEWNTVVLDLDPDSGEVAVSFIGDDGDVVGERLLTL